MTRDQLGDRVAFWLMVAAAIIATAVHTGHWLSLPLAYFPMRWAVTRVMTTPTKASPAEDDWGQHDG